MSDHASANDAVFSALADPTRRALLQTIAEQPASTATALAAALPITRQAVNKHLSALADAGLLDREREGREVHYTITPAPLTGAVSWMASVGGQCRPDGTGSQRSLSLRQLLRNRQPASSPEIQFHCAGKQTHQGYDLSRHRWKSHIHGSQSIG
jgi:DNA-binding transcriptional ArsR family regulator